MNERPILPAEVLRNWRQTDREGWSAHFILVMYKMYKMQEKKQKVGKIFDT